MRSLHELIYVLRLVHSVLIFLLSSCYPKFKKITSICMLTNNTVEDYLTLFGEFCNNN